MRKLWSKWHKWCVREKGHLVIGGGYIVTTFWHNTAIMSTVYGVAALMATHAIHRADAPSEPERSQLPRD